MRTGSGVLFSRAFQVYPVFEISDSFWAECSKSYKETETFKSRGASFRLFRLYSERFSVHVLADRCRSPLFQGKNHAVELTIQKMTQKWLTLVLCKLIQFLKVLIHLEQNVKFNRRKIIKRNSQHLNREANQNDSFYVQILAEKFRCPLVQ